MNRFCHWIFDHLALKVNKINAQISSETQHPLETQNRCSNSPKLYTIKLNPETIRLCQLALTMTQCGRLVSRCNLLEMRSKLLATDLRVRALISIVFIFHLYRLLCNNIPLRMSFNC